MPPLPSALGDDITEAIQSLRRRQKDLSEFQIPRLHSCKDSLAVQQQYAAELRDDLDAFARQVETLEVAVDDQRTERARRELGAIVAELTQSLARMRKDTRAAMLASKRAIDAKLVSNRDELLRSSAATEKQSLSEKVTEDALMKANNDVTEALQRTIGVMQGELERSVLSTQLLESSTANLRSTLTTHDVLDGLMSTSRHLITALEKSDWLDRVLVLAALAFFVLVVLFIFKQRVVDRGIRVAFWWTRFVPDFSGDSALLRDMEMGSASVVASALSTALTSAAAVVASSTSAALSSSGAVVVEESALSDASDATTTSSATDAAGSLEPTVLPPDAAAGHDEL